MGRGRAESEERGVGRVALLSEGTRATSKGGRLEDEAAEDAYLLAEGADLVVDEGGKAADGRFE